MGIQNNASIFNFSIFIGGKKNVVDTLDRLTYFKLSVVFKNVEKNKKQQILK